MSEYTSTRHLFLPCVQFELLVYPNGATEPTQIEKAAMLLIGSYWEAKEILAIDVFIDLLSLGEPAGRELINGLWRKGWIVIGGTDGSLYPSTTIQSHLREFGEKADFSNMGTSEPPQRFLLYYDLIVGRTFIAPNSRITGMGVRPYVVEPFYPESNDAPYGHALSSFIDLGKQDLISTLRHDGRFRRWRASREAMDFLVVPPVHNLGQKDIQYVRLFFDIGRNILKNEEDGWHRDFIMRGAERSNETLKRLADEISDQVVDKVLSQDTPLREKFLEEVQPTRLQKRWQKKRVRSDLGAAQRKFRDVEAAVDREVGNLFAEASDLTERAVQEISATLERSKMRQAKIRFVDGRAEVAKLADKILERSAQQAVLVSQESTAGKIVQAAQSAEMGQSVCRRLLLQTGGYSSATNIKTLKRKVDRARGLGSARAMKSNTLLDAHTQYVDRFDLFVDASVLVSDGAEILFAGDSLLVAGNAPQSAFHIELMDQQAADVRSRDEYRNAAKEILNFMAPTFVSPSPRLNVRANRKAPKHEPSRLETHLETLLRQLREEARSMEGGEATLSFGDVDARKLAGMIAEELQEIERLLDVYEKEAPLTVEALQDEDILIEAASMIARAPANMPLIIGLHPTERVDSLFKESVTSALEKDRKFKFNLIFLSKPNEVWLQYRNNLLSSYPEKVEIEDPAVLTSQVLAQRRRFSNFLISGLGCLVSSGGFTERILLGPRRRDKKQLGLVIRGKGAQEPLTYMLKALLAEQEGSIVPPVEVFFPQADRQHLEGFLGSQIFHRWLVEITKHEALEPGRDHTVNVGVDALRPVFLRDSEMYQRCLQMADAAGNEAYKYAVQKAGHLAGIIDRDFFASWLWERGNLFEAVRLCVDPKPEHLIGDTALRTYVTNVHIQSKSSPPDSIDPSWLKNEEILALLALDLLDPARRLALKTLDPDDLPSTPLGTLTRAIWAHAFDMPEGAIALGPDSRNRPPYPPQVYANNIGTTLKVFERDRGNRESHSVQTLLREEYGPILELFQWWQGQQSDALPSDDFVAGAIDAVRGALVHEFGDGFEEKLASRGNRERVATEVVNAFDEMNRQPTRNPTHRPLVGPKKQSLVRNVARTLELMITLHLAAKPTSDGSDVHLRRVVRKSAQDWLETAGTCIPTTPRSVLARIVRSDGRLAPEGHVDFGLWRFPLFLENKERDESTQVLGDCLLKEEWPTGSEALLVFEHLLSSGRFLAAEAVLKLWGATLPIGENDEETMKLLSQEEKLHRYTEEAAGKLLRSNRQLELEAQRAGEAACRMSATELLQLYGGLSLTPREVEDGLLEMRSIRRDLNKRIASGWREKVVELTRQGSLWKECSAAVNAWPASLRRSVIEAIRCYPEKVPSRLSRPVRANVTRSRLRNLLDGFDTDFEKAARSLEINENDTRALAILRNAPALFEERKYATIEECTAYITALNDLFMGCDDAVERVVIDSSSEESLWAQVELPSSGLRSWLDWQVPEYVVVVLLAETPGDIKLQDLRIPKNKLPVIINPFLLPPLLDEPHILIDLVDVISATSQLDPADAIKAMIVAKAGWDLVLPWEGLNEKEREVQLQRFLSCEQDDLILAADSERATEILHRLLTRLRVTPRWAQRRLFSDPTKDSLTASLCLAYCSAGHVAEAYKTILHARAKRFDMRGTIHVESFLETQGMSGRLVKQAGSMMRRWSRHRGIAVPQVKEATLQSILCDIWLHGPEGHDRETLIGLVEKSLLNTESEGELAKFTSETVEILADWLIADGLLVEAKTPGRFLPNPAHVLTTVDYT